MSSYNKVLFLLLIFLLPIINSCSAPVQSDTHPNVLIIVTDDQRYGTMQYMPQTQLFLFDQGIAFQHGYVTTPLCCPSRSSILTGMYARNHGVLYNEIKLKKPTFIELMKENGYYTGLVGKYLNSWKGDPRPEYDYWVSHSYGETRYKNPRLNVNGEWKRHQGEYVTYTFGNYVIDFIKEAKNSKKPFVLLYTPNAPHDPVTPADEDVNLYKDLSSHRPPSFNEEDVSDKPQWLQKEPLLTTATIAEIDEFRLNQIRALASLDRTIMKVIDNLSEQNMLDNTIIIFLSDNGMHWGEHRLFTKNRFYEEASKVPFAIYYPLLIKSGRVDSEHIVANIDIAPTVLELAGIPIPEAMDGVSLLPLLSTNPPAEWRKGIVLEGWRTNGGYTAVHTKDYVYADIYGDISEFYDLQNDPYQLQNLINDPTYQLLIEEHQALLKQLLEIK